MRLGVGGGALGGFLLEKGKLNVTLKKKTTPVNCRLRVELFPRLTFVCGNMRDLVNWDRDYF